MNRFEVCNDNNSTHRVNRFEVYELEPEGGLSIDSSSKNRLRKIFCTKPCKNIYEHIVNKY